MSEPTPKIFQTGAMKMEKGLLADPSAGWGTDSSEQSLGATDAFPWLTFSNKLTINTEEDASVTTRAFKTTPRMIGKMVDNPVSFYARFKGLNKLHYWMWGFENKPRAVVAVKGTFVGTPVLGEIFVDDDVVPNDYHFMREEVTRTESIYIFYAADTAAPTSQTGTFTASGSGAVLTVTSHSTLMYEHMYELDSYGRHYRVYKGAEVTAVSTVADPITITDKRNLMATFAKRMSNYDLRYKNAMCKDFSFKISAAGLAQYDCNYVAYSEERGSYSSADWTLPSGLGDASLVPAHFEMRFSIGETITNADGALAGLTEIALSDADLSIGTPMQNIQDFVSGLSIAEPVLEAKYDVKVTGTISRHTVETYQEFRDLQTKLRAHLVANQDWYMQEWMFKEITLGNAGPDDGNVAAEPLEMSCGYVEGGSEFDDWIEGGLTYNEVHDSPVVFRTRDFSSTNEMTAQ